MASGISDRRIADTPIAIADTETTGYTPERTASSRRRRSSTEQIAAIRDRAHAIAHFIIDLFIEQPATPHKKGRRRRHPDVLLVVLPRTAPRTALSPVVPISR